MKIGKSLYALAKNPGNRWKTIDPKPKKFGYMPPKSNSSVYIYIHNNMEVYIITLYVDDLLLKWGVTSNSSKK